MNSFGVQKGIPHGGCPTRKKQVPSNVIGYKKGSFPISEKCAEQLVSLPMFAELTKDQIEKVAHEINTFSFD